MSAEFAEISWKPESVWVPHPHLSATRYNAYLVFGLESFSEHFPDPALWCWDNTTIRTFADNSFDHIEHRSEGCEDVIGLSVSGRARSLADDLFENHYPYTYEPVPNPETYEWWLGVQRLIGATAIEAFLKKQGT